MSDEPIKLAPLLSAIDAHFKAGFPKLPTVGHYIRLTHGMPLPAVLTEIADIDLTGESGDDGAGHLCVTLHFSTFVVYSTCDGDERENKIAARALALRLAHYLKTAPFAQPVTPPKVTDIATDYLTVDGDNARGANNARLVECQRIDWDVSGYIGPDVWAELPIGTLVLGDPKVTNEYFPE